MSYLLAAHPNATTVGELSYFKRRVSRRPAEGTPGICACGANTHECPELLRVWRAGSVQLPWYLRSGDYNMFTLVASRRIDRILRYIHSRSTGAGLPIFAPLYRKVQMANRRAICAALEQPGAQLLVDASKTVERAVFLLNSGDYDIDFIHLSRDGRAQVNSCLHRNYLDVERASAAYAGWHRDILEFLDPIEASRRHRVVYEELCNNPVDVMSSLYRALGLSDYGLARDFRSATSHMIGNPNVVFDDSERIYNPEVWRQQMSCSALESFQREAGAMNRELGYRAD